MKQDKKGEKVCIYNFCYISLLIYNFWFSSFVPVDSNYHVESFCHESFALTSFVLLMANAVYFYILYGQQHIHVVLCNMGIYQMRLSVTINHCSFPISLFFICVYLRGSRGKRRDHNWFIVGLEVDQLCSTLWDPMDCSLPGTSVHGIFQARILEWVAIPFSKGSSQPRDRTQVSCIAGRFFTIWATREAS